jgi:hypothetical protein
MLLQYRPALGAIARPLETPHHLDCGGMDEPGTEGTEGRQDTEYSEKWSRELTSRVMGASYKLPTSDDYEASGQPEPLFMGTGYWLVDTDFCG